MSKHSRTREGTKESRSKSDFPRTTRTNGREKRWSEKLWALIFHNNSNNNIDGTWRARNKHEATRAGKEKPISSPLDRRDPDGMDRSENQPFIPIRVFHPKLVALSPRFRPICGLSSIEDFNSAGSMHVQTGEEDGGEERAIYTFEEECRPLARETHARYASTWSTLDGGASVRGPEGEFRWNWNKSN